VQSHLYRAKTLFCAGISSLSPFAVHARLKTARAPFNAARRRIF